MINFIKQTLEIQQSIGKEIPVGDYSIHVKLLSDAPWIYLHYFKLASQQKITFTITDNGVFVK